MMSIRTGHDVQVFLAVVVWGVVTTQSVAQQESAQVAGRPFYMGFSDWSYGTTAAHQEKTYDLIWENSDLICFQFDDGVPWPEAYEGKPFGKALQQRIDQRLEDLKKGHKVYLEISVLTMNRDAIAGYWGEKSDMPMPEPWNSYAIDDEHMITAYANYCGTLIDFFQPAFVNYSLEGSSLLFSSGDLAKPYLQFLKGVYGQLKEKHPEVRLGISATIHNPPRVARPEFQEKIADLLPCVDWLGASFYPFAFFRRDDGGNPNTLPEKSIGLIKELARGKPVAICETNWIAEDLVIETFGLNVPSSEAWQKDYVELLMKTAEEIDALFVVWWSIADFDIKWKAFPEEVKDVGRVWRDTGLLDENLNPRPGFGVWQDWFLRPVNRK